MRCPMCLGLANMTRQAKNCPALGVLSALS